MVVCKFGGSSLSDSGQIKKVRNIIRADSQRRFIVVSAPGKRNSSDIKITDLLYTCAKNAAEGIAIDNTYEIIEERFLSICYDLGININEIKNDLKKIKKNITDGQGVDYAASRGEFLSAKMLSLYLDTEFIDAADVIKLTEDGMVDPSSYNLLKEKIDSKRIYTLPGFFGADSEGKIKTFSRGGSDISGAIVSRAVNAKIYENWTDVSGLLLADPRIFDNPPGVSEITYQEIRELASLGTNVFHEEAIAPIRDVGIPINIKNTNKPEEAGTMILADRVSDTVPIAGLSGKTGFIPVMVKKFMLNRYPNFHCGILSILKEIDANPDFIFYGNDSIVYMVDGLKISDSSLIINSILTGQGSADKVEIGTSKGIIGIVGEGLTHKVGIAAQVISVLAQKSVNIHFASFGGSDVSFLIGVDDGQFQSALNAIYSIFKD